MSLSTHIKQISLSLGFDDCGMAKTHVLDEEMCKYKAWLNKDYNAGMHYMNNHLDIRKDTSLLIENAKTVIINLSNYYPSTFQNPDAPIVAKYAYGKDYHKVLRKKNQELLSAIQKHTSCNGRVFVDSAPVLERAWAVQAGLGWIGKSTMLISPKVGVHTLISGIVLDVEVDSYDKPMDKRCGRCTKCIDACPTNALTEPFNVDARECISYLSIEHRGDFDKKVKLHNSVFGCDRCTDACPFTKKIPHNEAKFDPNPKFIKLSKGDWENLSEEKFEDTFNGTPVRRAKYIGIRRNMNNL